MIGIDALRRITSVDELKPGTLVLIVTEPFHRHAKILSQPDVVDGKLVVDLSVEYLLTEGYHPESLILEPYLCNEDRDECSPSLFLI